MEEQDWQPVGIVIPTDSKCSHLSADYKYWPAGIVVRARVCLCGKPPDCSGSNRHFVIHPEDDWEPKNNSLCEHQILAD